MINAYMGSKPFAFISYSHEDTADVFPILEALSDRGIRLWYDRAIPGGADWTESIAAHIKTSACFLCLISNNYNDSRPCLRELNIALTHKIPTISIFLNRFQLSGGLEMQLSLEQMLFCDNFSSADALVDGLVSNSLLTACRMDGSDNEKEYVHLAVSAPVQQTVKPNAEILLNRAVIALEDGDWDDAAAFCGQMLNIDPENPQAYLALLLAQMQVKSLEQLVTVDAFSEDNKYYQKLLRFADEATRDALVQTLEKAKNAKLLRARKEAAQAHFKQYATIENGVLKKYTGSAAHIDIPTGVTGIGARAFYECKSLTSVTIPASVTSIGESAFCHCSALTSVTIPDSVTGIEEYAFGYCSALTSVTIPTSVTSIGPNAFSGCRSLTSVTIPTSVTSIGFFAFSHCEALTTVTIPDSVTSIEGGAFSGCKALTSVSLPGSVRHMDGNLFSYCRKLTEITVAADNPYFFVENGHLIDKRTKTLITGCGRAPIPTNGCVTSIGAGAFEGCGSLAVVTIPDSVTSIGKAAFCWSSALAVMIPSSVTMIGEIAFLYSKIRIFTAKRSFAWKWAKKNDVYVLEEGQDWQARLTAHYRKVKVCQHCGGKFNGSLLAARCTDCGRPKDY